MSRHTLRQFLTDDALARAAAGAWLDLIQSANQTNTVHTVALSGGRITKKFFAETVQQSKARALGGSVELQTRAFEGTSITIRLPITLAIVRAR